MQSKKLQKQLAKLAKTPAQEADRATFTEVTRTLDQIEHEAPAELQAAVDEFNALSPPFHPKYLGRLNHEPPEWRKTANNPGWADAFFQGRPSAKYGILRGLSLPYNWKRSKHSMDHLVAFASDLTHLESLTVGDKASAKHLKTWRGDGPWRTLKHLSLTLGKGTAKELGKVPLDKLENLDLEVQPGALQVLAKAKNIDHLQTLRIHMPWPPPNKSYDVKAELEALHKASWAHRLKAVSLSLESGYDTTDLQALAEACGWNTSLEYLMYLRPSIKHPTTEWTAGLSSLRTFYAISTAMNGQDLIHLLNNNPTLENLYWHGGAITDPAMKALAGFQGRLKSLDIGPKRGEEDCHKDETLEDALRSDALQTLEYFNPTVLSSGQAQILVKGGLPALKRLRFNYVTEEVGQLLRADARMNRLIPASCWR